MGAFSGPKITTESTYVYHVCTTSGIFTSGFTGTVEVLVVAGGGGGGMDMGGGGGGGGVLSSTSYSVTSESPITVTVGSAGVGAPAGGPPNNSNYHQFLISGTQGGNSGFGSLTAIGGGYGGSSYVGYTPNYAQGGAGGSGGGSSGYAGNTGTFGAGTAGQGNKGGYGATYYSGGGGGAGAQGVDATGQPNGGAGILNNILGIDYYWGGGGGGSAYSASVGGNGGAGGGGGGSSGGLGDTTGMNPGKNAGAGGGVDWVNTPGGDAGRYTGGGGGGGMHYNRSNRGGNGGSGVVIIRHLSTSGTSTFSSSGAHPLSSLVLSLDAANTGKSSSVEVLIVGGGGGGGSDMGGGGGGGKAYVTNYSTQIGVPITVTIGSGGSGATGYANSPPPGSIGGTTSFGLISAIGGGGGGSGHYFPNAYGTGYGTDGGNAGGDSPKWGRNRGNGQISTSGGYEGGASGHHGDGSYTAGGGGGNSEPGWGGRGSWRAGNGGVGLYSAINGTSYYWGGGGGGAHHEVVAGNGGAGGGGGGSGWSGGTAGTGGAGLNAGGNGVNATTSSVGGAGGANTGGGGGGGGHQSVGGAGGSGIVIVRYYGSQQATGGTITSSGGYTIHTFTSSGTFTPTGWIGLKDTSSSGITATVVGATYSSGNQGYYTFNGTTDKITVSTNSLFSGTQDYTVESVIRISTASSTDYIFGNYGTGNSTGLEYYVWQNKLNNYISGNVQSSTTLNINQWYHVIVTRNGTTVTHYLNGIADGSGTLGNSIGTGSSFTVGNGPDYTSEAFGGNIALVKVYNKALSASEVLQNFNALRGRFII